MEAGKRAINDIFNGNRVLEIPFFQRKYVWGKEEWLRFIEDMEHISQTNKPYFLGSIILKQQGTTSGQDVGDRRTLIDGQQRLTTMCVFFKVLSLKIDNDNLSNIFRLPMMDNEIALIHNHSDVSAFNKILDLKKIETIADDNNLTAAYKYFTDNIDTAKLDFKKILANVMFVGVDLSAEEDEQQIFDTINSLGVRLTTAELLKNYFFNKNTVDLYNEFWLEVFEKDDECKKFWDTEFTSGRVKRYFIDLFFYSLLQIKIQNKKNAVSAEDKLEFSKVDGLFNSYKNFIDRYKIEKKALIKEIKEYAGIFKKTFDMSVGNSELSSSDYNDRINLIIFNLENTTLIPYILFINKNVSDSEEKNKILCFLETYIMRRMVCHANTKNYNQLFGEQLILNQVVSLNQLKEHMLSLSDKVNYMPSDEEVKDGFYNSKLINKQTGGILYMIETKIRNQAKHSTAVLGFNFYTLEHIMPKKWETFWGSLENESDKINRDRKLLTLGNLTIITGALNSSIKNSSWEIKKNGKDNKPGLKYYASGLDTFSNFLTLEKWDEQEIKKRAEFLYKKAVEEVWVV